MMRRRWRRWAGQGALFALLLQLALPLTTLHQATAGQGLDTPFVICTSSGLVWVNPDGTPAPGGEGGPEPGHHCPVCFSKHIAGAALLPVAPSVPAGPEAVSQRRLAVAAVLSPAAALPPLPARGPPVSS